LRIKKSRLVSLPRTPRPSPILQARLLAVVVLVLLAGACGDSSTDDDGAGTGPDSSGMHTLTGDISIEGAYELSHIPASRIAVQLEDISLQDVSSVLIAEEVYEGVTTLPLTYELTWTGELHPQGDYTVGARVYDEGGELRFVTDTVFPVCPGDGKVDGRTWAVRSTSGRRLERLANLKNGAVAFDASFTGVSVNHTSRRTARAKFSTHRPMTTPA